MDKINPAHGARRQRLRFIESLAYWEGAVQRQRVCDATNVTPNHLSRDFKWYRAAYPENLIYDVSARCYRPGKAFQPQLATCAPEEYLALLLLRTNSSVESGAMWLPGPAAADAVPTPGGAVSRDVLRDLTRAIAQKRAVQVTYQSMTTPQLVNRLLWPHALVYNGWRWHVRAYDTERERFADFVLARFGQVTQAAAGKRKAEASPESDVEWITTVTIAVTPATSLTADQAKVIAREYGMAEVDGRQLWAPTMRRCLAPYFGRLYRLDTPSQNSPIQLQDLSQAALFVFEQQDA